MRLHLSVVDPRYRSSRRALWHAVVDCSSDALVQDLASALTLGAGNIGHGLIGEEKIAESGVVSGVILPYSAAGNQQKRGSPTVRLEVVGGPFSGQVFPLLRGIEHRIGADQNCTIHLDDPAMYGQCITVLCDALSINICSQELTPQLYLNGLPADQKCVVHCGDLLQLGASIIRFGYQPAADADLCPNSLGTIAFNRSARIRPRASLRFVRFPGDKPPLAEKTSLPWLSALIPVVCAVVMAFIFERPLMLLTACVSPLLVIVTYAARKKALLVRGVRTVQQWRAEVAETKENLVQLSNQQRSLAWADFLDPVQVSDIALLPTSRLWERRAVDEDAVMLRVGVGERPLKLRSNSGENNQPLTLGVSPVPIMADLRSGVLGIAGQRVAALSLLRAILCHLAVLRSPRDCVIILLCSADSSLEWEWIRWLPHCRAVENSFLLIGNSEKSRHARIRELVSLLEVRKLMRKTDPHMIFTQHSVLVIDGARLYREIPGLVELLTCGFLHGIFVLAADEERARLPEECAIEILFDHADITMGRVESVEDSCSRVLFDGLSLPAAEKIARALSPLLHIAGIDDTKSLPASVRFSDICASDSPEVVWQKTPRSTRALIGVGLAGPIAVDLARDGPHAVIAGTTGSGKSELLQTLILSLASVNRPDALNFVLVDYKGGSAFAECEKLPHTVGLVTNLDAHETQRALHSLEAEINRREKILTQIGFSDVESVWQRDPNLATENRLARLVLAIDEFAELKAELPDFVNGLVRIARLGRSLGIHLILATQRPSGVMTAEMQSNMNLRIALRVLDAADSIDVLGSPDAANISSSEPGRAYIRQENGGPPLLFQTARVSFQQPMLSTADSVKMLVHPLPWSALGEPLSRVEPKRSDRDTQGSQTDLHFLVAQLIHASDVLQIRVNASPWLKPLPEMLELSALPSKQADQSGIFLGCEDLPSRQAQRSVCWNPHNDSHFLLIGGSRSGRTSTLRVVVAQLAQEFASHTLHFYLVDYGSGELLPADGVQHCGAYLVSGETERFLRLIDRLLLEAEQRKKFFSLSAVGEINTQRLEAKDPKDRLPFIVVIIDGWDRIASHMQMEEMFLLREKISQLLREGHSLGIRFLISGDRGLITDRIFSLVHDKYFFPLADRDDYRSAGLSVRTLPLSHSPGRVYGGSPIREIQMALLVAPSSSETEGQAFRRILTDVRSRQASLPSRELLPRPFRIDGLPASIALNESLALPPFFDSKPEKNGGITVAVFGNELARMVVDWSAAAGLLVMGEAKTGRSMALAMITEQLAHRGDPVCVLATRTSVLQQRADSLKLPLCRTIEEFILFCSQKNFSTTRLTVVIDDIDLITEKVADEFFSETNQECAYLISCTPEHAGKTFRGPLSLLKKRRQGLFLSPASQTYGSQIFGVPLPKLSRDAAIPGRATVLWNGTYQTGQVPRVSNECESEERRV